MTISGISMDFEKQIVLRTIRLIRVRNVRCLRSYLLRVLRLPGLWTTGMRFRSYAPQESV